MKTLAKNAAAIMVGSFGMFLLLTSIDINHGGLALLVYITGSMLLLLGLSVLATRLPDVIETPARFPRLNGKTNLPKNVRDYLSQVK